MVVAAWAKLTGAFVRSTGIIIVDHGSRLQQSNQLLEELAGLFGQRFPSKYPVVEPAHMELAEPSIDTAYGRCVQRGAGHLVVCPYFLGPGRHWTHDIPRLVAAAAARFPGTTWQVTQTLGIDELMLRLLDRRISQATDLPEGI